MTLFIACVFCWRNKDWTVHEPNTSGVNNNDDKDIIEERIIVFIK